MLALLVLFNGILHAQQNDLFKKQWLIQDGDTMPYRILFPENFDPAKKYPVMYFLHGRGESGEDNEKQLIHGSSMFLRDSLRKKYPAIVVFPQCPDDNYWSNVVAVSEGQKYGKRSFYFTPGGEPTRPMKRVMALVENINMRFKVDEDRVYVMGLSMGGMGTFELVRRMPGVFAAAIPICGGANPKTAASLKKTSWWIFHGLKDDVVDPQFSKDMHAALKNVNADVKMTLYPNANHNSWDAAFQENLFGWMFSKKRVLKITQRD